MTFKSTTRDHYQILILGGGTAGITVSAQLGRKLKTYDLAIIEPSTKHYSAEGKSTDWVMGHVRAGLDVVEKEITESGFKRIGELKEVLKENYLVAFVKVDEGERKSDK